MVAVPSIGRADQVAPQRSAPEADQTRRLYEQYARQIYAYCLHQLGNREEAEDATQSTFLNAFRGLQRGVDPEFETAWLYKIAQNVCLTRQRSSSRRRRVESPGDLDAIQDVLPAREAESDDLIGLPEALGSMPEQQRRALLLREWQGLSYREIGDELGLSQAAVETLLFRARRSLAAGLTVGEEDEKPEIAKRLQKGGDAGSVLAVLKSLLVTGGAKVVATVATVAATSVVAATPAARHAVAVVVDQVPQAHHPVAAQVAPPKHVKRTAVVHHVAASATSAASTAVPHARVVAGSAPASAVRKHRLQPAAHVVARQEIIHVSSAPRPLAPVEPVVASPTPAAPAQAPAAPAPAEPTADPTPAPTPPPAAPTASGGGTAKSDPQPVPAFEPSPPTQPSPPAGGSKHPGDNPPSTPPPADPAADTTAHSSDAPGQIKKAPPTVQPMPPTQPMAPGEPSTDMTAHHEAPGQIKKAPPTVQPVTNPEPPTATPTSTPTPPASSEPSPPADPAVTTPGHGSWKKK